MNMARNVETPETSEYSIFRHILNRKNVLINLTVNLIISGSWALLMAYLLNYGGVACFDSCTHTTITLTYSWTVLNLSILFFILYLINVPFWMVAGYNEKLKAGSLNLLTEKLIKRFKYFSLVLGLMYAMVPVIFIIMINLL